MAQNNYRAIFFDLDGTLLPMDIGVFMHTYLEMLTRFVKAHGLETNGFDTALFRGVDAMSENDGTRSNADVFWDVFFSMVDEDRATWIPLFEQFYSNEFNAIGKGVVPDPAVIESLGILQDKGYPLVCATTPMFPLVAVEWRIKWAGLDPRLFSRITHFENSTATKPSPVYYKENLRAARLKPQDVLMVGNDTGDDLVCLQLGMDAYLVTDFLINAGDFDISTVKHGCFVDFLAWAKALPPCANPATEFETGLIV